MKKILTFIPIIGIINVIILSSEESGLTNKIIFCVSGWIQSIAISVFLIWLLNI